MAKTVCRWLDQAAAQVTEEVELVINISYMDSPVYRAWSAHVVELRNSEKNVAGD